MSHPGVPPSLFHAAYEGQAPWDVGQPQPSIIALAEQGAFGPRVLDVGCGPGDNAIMLAQRGHQVTALDFVPKAIERARAKAQAAGVTVDFRVHDALKLGELGETYDTVLDSAMFHGFSDEDRVTLIEGLRRVLRPGGTLYVLCFSEAETRGEGPRRVRAQELREAFSQGFRVDSIEPTRYMDRHREDGAHAWLARMVRT